MNRHASASANHSVAGTSDVVHDQGSGQGDRHKALRSRVNLTMFLCGATVLGLAGSRYIKASGQRPLRLTGTAPHHGSGPSLFSGLLAIASGAALGGLFSQRRTETPARAESDESKDHQQETPKLDQAEWTIKSTRDTGHATTAAKGEISPERSIAVAALQRNAPNYDTPGSEPVNAPGPETWNVVYRGTQNADS